MECDESPTSREYSALSATVENLPYATMILLGACIMAAGFKFSTWAWIGAGAYSAFGILGPLWIILFLCPHCPSYGRRSCPCGYGVLSAKLRPKGEIALFTRQFRKHIPVIVPLWIVPVLVGGVLMSNSSSWQLAILLGAFVLDSFVLLPLRAKSHGCKCCPQRDVCPWMVPGQTTGIATQVGPPTTDN